MQHGVTSVGPQCPYSCTNHSLASVLKTGSPDPATTFQVKRANISSPISPSKLGKSPLREATPAVSKHGPLASWHVPTPGNPSGNDDQHITYIIRALCALM